jgi:hypothetical protein
MSENEGREGDDGGWQQTEDKARQESQDRDYADRQAYYGNSPEPAPSTSTGGGFPECEVQ